MFMAQCLEMLGQIDDAERSFREAVAAAPDDQVALRSLAAFLVRQGRLQAAREEMEAIIAADHDDPTTLRTKMWARRMLAEIEVQAGGYRDIERAVKLLDDNADRNGLLAAEDLAMQSAILAARPDPSSWRRALGHLEKLASLQPLSNAQRTQKAKLLEQLGRWDECRNELVSIASASNTPPAFHTLLIETLLRHKELDSAQIWLKTLSNRLPDSPVVWALQAKLSLAQNDRTAAVAAIRKLMPGDAPAPELANNLVPLADLLEELGFNAAADKVFTQLAASSTDGVIARTGFLGRAQRGDEALDLLEQSWKDIPLEKALRIAISVLDSLGDNATKLQSERVGLWFAKARRQDPESPRLALLFADFVSMTGDEEKVVSIYRELLARKDIAPQQAATVANNLAFHLAEPDSSAEALKLVDSALAELGPHPDVLDTRGVVLLAAGKGEESIAELKESLLAPSATKYLHLAQALASQQQLEAARTALAEAKKLGFSKRRLVSGDRQRLNALEAAIGQ
jgi:predicted Zn-dependent protease